MRPFGNYPLLALLLACSASMAIGQTQNGTAAPSAPASGSPILAAPQPTSDDTATAPRHRTRVISSDLAAQLSAATPKYTPPPPAPKPTPEEEQPDLREIDKPKNSIIRLPKYVVHEKPPPVLSEKVVNTQKGLADIAMKRYLSETYHALNPFTLPLFGTSPEATAMTMYAEDERLKNMSELKDDAGMVSTTDKAAGMYVKRQVDQTFMRPGDFDWKPIGK